MPVWTGPSFWCAACGANQMVLYCGLKQATGCFGSEESWQGLSFRPMSDTVCDQLGTTCQELQSDPQLVAACAEPGACGRGHTEK